MSELHFERRDPETTPASDLLREMRQELGDLYGDVHRLDTPPLAPAELRPPHGAYLVGFDGEDAVAGGGVRRLSADVAEVKRMFVRPAARSRGVARALLAALEDEAARLGYTAARLDTGPKQVHAAALYRSAGYVEIPAYNENPYACFWGEKALT